MNEQLVCLRSGEFLKALSSCFNYRLTDGIGRLGVEQSNHITAVSKFGTGYKNFWRNLVRVELLFFWLLFSINRCRICPSTYYLSIFIFCGFSPIIQLYQGQLLFFIVSSVISCLDRDLTLKFRIFGVLYFGSCICFLYFCYSLFETFFFTLSWSFWYFLCRYHWLGGYFANGSINDINNIRNQDQILLNIENELKTEISHVCLFFYKFRYLSWLEVSSLKQIL